MSTNLVITCASEVKDTPDEIRGSSLLTEWLERINTGTPCYGDDNIVRQVITVRGVHVYAADRWGPALADGKPEIKMMYIKADAVDQDGNLLTGLGHLRSDTVEVVALLEVEGHEEQYIVFVAQPRVPGGQVVLALPAGMVDADDEGNFGVAGIRELRQELGDDKICWSPLVDLNNCLLYGYPSSQRGDPDISESLGKPLLVSPGGTSERARIMLTKAQVSQDVLAQLRFRFGGAQDEGERTQVVVSPLSDAIRRLASVGNGVDAKAILGILLYQEYRRRVKPALPASVEMYYFTRLELTLRILRWLKRLIKR